MQQLDQICFEVGLVSFVFALGQILFGHFEERTPRLKKLVKFVLVLLIVVSTSFFFGRAIALLLFAVMLSPAIYIHLIYLPKHGINGWTGEPRAAYYKLRGWNLDGSVAVPDDEIEKL